MSLNHVRVVLVETSHPGNIGACARAMKNMGLSELYLVNPKIFPSSAATARASGASDVLARARVCASLEEAVQDCTEVFGASARSRTIPWPQLTPRECAARINAQPGPAALVIGREHSGLTNAELERCNYLVHIPSNPAFSSLNVAAAVQVLAYEIFLAAAEPRPVAQQEQQPPATAEELERLYAHMQQALIDIEFLDPLNPRQLMRRLRRLFNRAHLDKIELNILRGILTAAQQARQKHSDHAQSSSNITASEEHHG
ncbi:MAG: RNA methyltransferase [Pseudomonadota bacterium]